MYRPSSAAYCRKRLLTLQECGPTIVGRERRERVSQLAWCGGGCFDSRRRINSTVRHLPWRSSATQTLIDIAPTLNFRRVWEPGAKLQTIQTSIRQGNQNYGMGK